jgi:hypothetical protein
MMDAGFRSKLLQDGALRWIFLFKLIHELFGFVRLSAAREEVSQTVHRFRIQGQIAVAERYACSASAVKSCAASR